MNSFAIKYVRRSGLSQLISWSLQSLYCSTGTRIEGGKTPASESFIFLYSMLRPNDEGTYRHDCESAAGLGVF